MWTFFYTQKINKEMYGKIILLTGIPGVGKTTLLHQLLSLVDKSEGFLTEEVLDDKGKRIGFDLISVRYTNLRKELARLYDGNLPDAVKLDKWSILSDGIGYFVDNEMNTLNEGHVFILDEIGPMQCLSEKFMQRVESIIKSCSTDNYLILGTIKRDICGIKQIDDFMYKVKEFVGKSIFEVTEKNREYLYTILEKEINTFIDKKLTNIS